MKSIGLFFLLLPFFAGAQASRSESELARDNIQAYLTGKIFRSSGYHALSYSKLKPSTEHDANISWVVEHRFETLDHKGSDSTRRQHQFVFYLNKRMEVFRAETVE